MKVYLFDKNQVNIYLNPQEINDIFGGYENIDYDIPDCRIKIHGIIAATLPQSLLPLDCTKLLIEVKPADPGCTITLTKVYCDRFKNTVQSTTALIFENSESLILSLAELNNIQYISSELYTNNQKYAIIITGKDEISIHISEYCKITKSKFASGKIHEYWQLVCGNDAIKTLSTAFLK